MNNPIAMLEGHLAEPNSTQARLAERIGISPQFLSEILKAKRNPSKRVLDFLGLEKVVTYQPRQTRPTITDRRAANRRRA